MLERLRGLVGGDPTAALVLPFNVTLSERDVALAIGAPIYGVDHRFAQLGRKSAGRRLFRETGVRCAPGIEDVRSVADIERDVADLRAPGGMVVKLDDSVFGEGNLRLGADTHAHDLPREYLADLERLGGVVESWMTGEEVESPSVQLRILPGDEPLVISSHDQLLGGDNGQMFVGCRFPARAPYHATALFTEQAHQHTGPMHLHHVLGLDWCGECEGRTRTEQAAMLRIASPHASCPLRSDHAGGAGMRPIWARKSAKL